MNDGITRDFVSTVYLFREGKVLFMFHPFLKKFIPIGGHIEENELPCDAAIREAKEESGFDVELINFDSSKGELVQNFDVGLDVIKPDHHHVNLAYLAKVIGGEQMEMADTGTELRWFSLNDLMECRDIFDSTKKRAVKAFKLMESVSYE